MKNSEKTLDMIVNLCKNRGFVFPGSEIYGGLANSWDYGPLGVEFKNNVKKAWLKKFVQESPYNVGLDADIDLGLAACDARGGRLLHGVIQKAELARRLYRAVQIAVVDRTQLDGNGASMQHRSRAAVAGHTLHFISSPSGKSM